MIKYLQELSAYFRQICLTSHFNFTERVWRDVCKYFLHVIAIFSAARLVTCKAFSIILFHVFEKKKYVVYS